MSNLVGKLNYFTIMRPDILFAFSIVSQFMFASRLPHWEAVLLIKKKTLGGCSKNCEESEGSSRTWFVLLS